MAKVKGFSFDGPKLREALGKLQVQAQHQNLSPERQRQERAHLTVTHLIIQRTWYGPAPCEGCTFFYGRHSLNCAPHPNGPPSPHCADWSGALSTEENFYYVPSQGWTWQRYMPGRGWVILRDQIPPSEVSAGLEIASYFDS